jgi:hypothetical protein
MPEARSRKKEIPVFITCFSLLILLSCLYFTRIIQPYLTLSFAYADISACITVLSMVRITAKQSILKQHQVLITALLVITNIILAILLLLFYSAPITVNSVLVFCVYCYILFFVLLDLPVFISIKIIDWRAEKNAKPNQSLSSKMWEL